jgi:hypothetical protein
MEAARLPLSLSVMGATAARAFSHAPCRDDTGAGTVLRPSHIRNNALAAGRSENPLTTMPCV